MKGVTQFALASLAIIVGGLGVGGLVVGLLADSAHKPSFGLMLVFGALAAIGWGIYQLDMKLDTTWKAQEAKRKMQPVPEHLKPKPTN